MTCTGSSQNQADARELYAADWMQTEMFTVNGVQSSTGADPSTSHLPDYHLSTLESPF